MKKHLLLIFSILISFVTYAELIYMGKGETEGVNSGMSFYFDNENVKKHNGFVYYWTLTDALVPTVYGDLSWKTYHQGDCNTNRSKILAVYWYTLPMGKGPTSEINNADQFDWTYPVPESSGYYELLLACKFAN